MEIEELIRKTLIENTSVTNIVSNRVYPGEAPPNAIVPYVVYQPPTRERLRSLTGHVDLNRWLSQIDCYSYTYDQAKKLWRAVVLAIQTIVGIYEIQAILEESTDGTVEFPVTGENLGLIRLGLEFSIWKGGN